MGAAELMGAVRELMTAAGLPLGAQQEELLSMVAQLKEARREEQRDAAEVGGVGRLTAYVGFLFMQELVVVAWRSQRRRSRRGAAGRGTGRVKGRV